MTKQEELTKQMREVIEICDMTYDNSAFVRRFASLLGIKKDDASDKVLKNPYKSK